MQQNFKIMSASLLSAVLIAGLSLFTNLIPTEKLTYFIAGIAVFVVSGGITAYILQITAASSAEKMLKSLSDECTHTLNHVRNEYTSSILKGAIIHDSELDILERSTETEEVWVITPLNLDHDVPGKVFFASLKENLDHRNIQYTYIIKDTDKARHNAREIAGGINNKTNLKFALLNNIEWNALPIAGIPVTIHNPNNLPKMRIYISTQQSSERGQHWAVFSGWTTAQIIERTRTILRKAKNIKTLSEYSS